jgi:hypothetical protein
MLDFLLYETTKTRISRTVTLIGPKWAKIMLDCNSNGTQLGQDNAGLSL